MVDLSALCEAVETKNEKALELLIEQAVCDLHRARANRKIRCLVCLKKNKVKDLILVQQMYWNPNTGDPNGGYYATNEDYTIWCPQCATESRYFSAMDPADLHQWKKIVVLASLFKDVHERYPDDEYRRS